MPQPPSSPRPSGGHPSASPRGNAWGQRFQQQFGSPPGQMRPQFQAFRQQGMAPPPPPPGGGFVGQGPPPPIAAWQDNLQAWRDNRPMHPEDGFGGDPLARQGFIDQMHDWRDMRPRFDNALMQHWRRGLLNR